MNKYLGLFAVFVLGFSSSASAQMSGQEIMNQNEDVRRLEDVHSDATLTTGGGGNPTRVKQFTWWRKLLEDKVHFNTLTRFHLPAEIRGEGILFLEHGNDDN